MKVRVFIMTFAGVAGFMPLQASEEIVVTNERRVQTAMSVPLSVDVLSRARLTDTSAIHPAELLNTASGVNIHRGSGQEHLTAIRSPVLTGGAGAGSFLYLLDGVPLRAAGFGNVNGLFEAPGELSGRRLLLPKICACLWLRRMMTALELTVDLISKRPCFAAIQICLDGKHRLCCRRKT